jgi:hypothetical protein
MITFVAPLAVMERAIHKTVRTRATGRRLRVAFSKSMDHHQRTTGNRLVWGLVGSRPGSRSSCPALPRRLLATGWPQSTGQTTCMRQVAGSVDWSLR